LQEGKFLQANTVTPADNKLGRRGLSRKHRDYIWAYLFIAPTVGGILLFLIGPMIYSFFMSLTAWNVITDPVFIGFDNYIRMFNDNLVRMELVNTLLFALFIVPFNLVFALLIAVLLNRKIRGIGGFRIAMFLPYITLPVASAVVWQHMFNNRFGMINGVLRMLDIPVVDWLGGSGTVFTIIVAMTVWASMGYFSIILLVGLKNMPISYHEAAKIDGASSGQTFFKITLPLLTPQIFFVVIMSAIGAFQMFDAILIFGRSIHIRDGIRTLTYGIYERAFLFHQMGYATANAVVLFTLIMLVTIMNFAFQKFWVHYDN